MKTKKGITHFLLNLKEIYEFYFLFFTKRSLKCILSKYISKKKYLRMIKIY